MKRIKIVSSNLLSIGYDPEKRILEIAFTSGAVYQYFNVPRILHIGLMNAESKGSYFASMIKPRYSAPNTYKRIK